MIRAALAEFWQWLIATGWRGKENDCVNAFTHGFLLKHAQAGIDGFDSACMGIEVGVPQPAGQGTRAAVRRDLVIWNKRFDTTWDSSWQPVNVPRVIVEWKARRSGKVVGLDRYDVGWLTAMSQQHPEFTGYAVTVDFATDPVRLHTGRIRGGEMERDIHLTAGGSE